ncbi:MAG: hypothetical protein CMJ84_10690 [Planctomycetes bacterium]|jgi:hypothetical protein|nr:hypothetical protein [Planctomycetota bacterium]MDP6410023.1 hypothetical protein [Planctomycetota bacterium]
MILFALAAALVAGDPVLVPTPAAPGSVTPHLVSRGECAWLSWTEEVEDGHRLRLASLAPEGFSPARTVAEGGPWFVNWADFPTFAVGDQGALIATFLPMSAAGTFTYDAVFARVAPGRLTFSSPRKLHRDEVAGEHGFVSLAPLGGGRFAACWLDGRAMGGGHGGGHGAVGAMRLYTTTIEADGDLGAERLLDDRVCECCQTALVRLADGALLLCYRDRGEGEERDIGFVRGEPVPDGAWSWSAPRSVHRDGWVIAGCPVNGPALAAGADGAAVCWFTLGSGGRPRVRVARLDESGRAFGPPVDVDDGQPEGRVDLVFDGAGRLWATWLERVGEEGVWRLREVPAPHASALPVAVDLARVPLERRSGFLRAVVVGEALLATWTTPEGIAVARVPLPGVEEE